MVTKDSDEPIVETPTAVCGSAAPSSLAREAEQRTPTHDWGYRAGFRFEVCNLCGVVRRKDNKNNPCKGVLPSVIK